MSLEQALAENTAAVKALTAALAEIATSYPVTEEGATLASMARAALSALPQPTAPTVQPAPTVLSTVAASPEQTAPVVLTVSLPDPTSVFGQAALPSAPPATPAAPPTASPAPTGSPQQSSLVAPMASLVGASSRPLPSNVAVDACLAQHGMAMVDKNDLPWDGRIHASSKAMVADGSWRMKRGVDPDLVTQVTAELRQTMSAPAGTSALANQPWPFATSGADVAPASTFAGLMAVLPGKMVAGELTTDQIAAACASVGVPNLPALAAREDLVPAVAAALGLTQ